MPGHGESSFDPELDYSIFGIAEKVHLVSTCMFYCKLRVALVHANKGVGISVVFL